MRLRTGRSNEKWSSIGSASPWWMSFSRTTKTGAASSGKNTLNNRRRNRRRIAARARRDAPGIVLAQRVHVMDNPIGELGTAGARLCAVALELAGNVVGDV